MVDDDDGDESPSGKTPKKAPRWDLMGTEGCSSGKELHEIHHVIFLVLLGLDP